MHLILRRLSKSNKYCDDKAYSKDLYFNLKWLNVLNSVKIVVVYMHAKTLYIKFKVLFK
ncbi:hypothetical protein BY458DRAFT_530622 [Sporodiniella umbellata]|nr:hypothetical protein BY458DRAFT_530622 [Sporodiniella umbellata]